MSDHRSARHSARLALGTLFSFDRFFVNLFSLHIWSVGAAIAFIALIVFGVLPRIPW
jgi:hypothetical protein